MTFYKEYTKSFDKEPGKYQLSGYRLGSPTSPMTAKQLPEFSARLNEGVKNIEVGTIDPNLFDTVPTEHLEAIKQLSVLTDSNVSVHAPIVDPAGFDDKGNWSEHQRKANEQQIASILEKSSQLSKNGNIPVVLHSTAGAFAQQYDKELDNTMEWYDYDKGDYKRDDNGKILMRPGIRALGVIDQEEGKIGMTQWSKKYLPGEFDGKEYVPGEKKDKLDVWDPWKKLHSMNESRWDEEKLKILSYQNEIDKLSEKAKKLAEQNLSIANAGLNTDKFENYQEQFKENSQKIKLINKHREQLDMHVRSGYKELHTKLVEYAPKEETHFYDEYQKKFPKYQKRISEINSEIEKIKKSKPTNEKEQSKLEIRYQQLQEAKKYAIMTDLADMPTPQIYKPVADFAKEQTSKTVANAMYQFYERNKNKEGFELEKMPILAMENVFPTSPLSRAKELKEAVKESRKIFAERLAKEGKVSTKKAKDAANKLIGATWDVGHINQLRKSGYSEEELRDLVIKETKDIAPVVKHLHITDNFGFGDTHLPPGMGNVPIKEMLEELEKKGFEGRAIVEAGNFVKEFGVSPTHEVLEYFNSPMYNENDPMYRLGPGPYWQSEMFPQYKSSYIEFPQQHFNLYGSSFTTLPKELGGEMGNTRDRFTGTPNA